MCREKSIKWAILLVIILGASMIQAQMIGIPVGNQGQGQWSLAATGSFMTQLMGSETGYSTRWLVKSTYGIVPWLDLVGMIGAADLRLDSPSENSQDFKSKPGLAVGAGLTLTLKRETETEPLGIFAGAHLLRFPSKGQFNQTVSGEDIIYLHREFRFEYDSREALFFGGLSYRLGNFRIYGGGIGWSISRLEKKMQYEYENEENKEFIKEQKNEFQSDMWTGGLAGIEVLWPKTGYRISFECLYYNNENFTLMVGIGQTGVRESGW
jgi:hypothetical protein